MRKKIGIICLLMVICIISIAPKSYGAIASKPTTKTDGSNVLVNKSISEAFVLCKNMTSNGESLYGATVKPHLATNKDWGAVAYLSNSSYGTNTAGKNTGVQLTMNGVNYYSTTGNTSGVMNWGLNPNIKFYSYTASFAKSYLDRPISNDYITELKIAANNNSSYVEVINTEEFNNENTLGMAMFETIDCSYGQWKSHSTSNFDIVGVRQGLFGFTIGNFVDSNGYGWLRTTGSSLGYITFRPVIWN